MSSSREADCRARPTKKFAAKADCIRQLLSVMAEVALRYGYDDIGGPGDKV